MVVCGSPLKLGKKKNCDLHSENLSGVIMPGLNGNLRLTRRKRCGYNMWAIDNCYGSDSSVFTYRRRLIDR